MQHNYFCSDELYERIKSKGMRGWDFHRCKALKQ